MRREILIVRSAVNSGSWSSEAPQAPLGAVSEVKDALESVFGPGTWQVADQGLFDGEGFSLLAKLSIFDPVQNMVLEVWGAADPLPSVTKLCTSNGWQAVDLDSWQLVQPSDQA